MTTTRTINWTALAGLMLMLATAGGPAAQEPKPKPTPTPDAQDARALKDDKDKTSYAVGMNLGTAVRRQSADQSADLDVNLILQGFKDAFGGGKTLLTEVEMRTVLNRLQAELKSKQAAQRSENGKAEGTAPAATPASPGINISVKRDPRISKGLYTGDVWLSLPYSQVGTDKTQATVEARAEVRDAAGRPTKIGPKWIPADPEMVTVTPSEGSEVKITARRPGETSLEVTSQGVSTKLAIKAEYKGEALLVQISQK